VGVYPGSCCSFAVMACAGLTRPRPMGTASHFLDKLFTLHLASHRGLECGVTSA